MEGRLNGRRLRQEQAAYIAGILDGEGYVALSRKKDKTMRAGFSYRPIVEVTQVRPEVLYWLKSVTGVGTVSKPAVSKQPNCRPSRRWVTWSQQASWVLEQARPYLILKLEQADILIEFSRVALQNRYGCAGLPKEEHARQNAAYRLVKKLNKRGLK